MRKRLLFNAFVVFVFTVGISLPLVQLTTGALPRTEVVDNRTLAPLPSLELTRLSIAQYPGQFEAWYADHMGMRGLLVSGYRWLTDAVLRSPDHVMIGRDGWLYLRKGVRQNVETAPLVRDWCGRFTFTEKQLESWVSTISANKTWLDERGIAYLFVVPPNKMSVIPEHLPKNADCRHGTTRLQQLKAALARRTGIEVLDLKGVLRRAFESGESIWYRTDTHWNVRGVVAAYPALLERILALQPAARRIESFVVSKQRVRMGDLGLMVQLDGLTPDAIWLARPADPLSRETPTPFSDQTDSFGRRSSARLVENPDLPTALVFHDSFFDGLMNDFLSESFSRTVFVFHGHPEIDRSLVEQEKPDIVIHEMVERNLLHPFY